MGKIAAAAVANGGDEMKRKKKKGRPSLLDLQKRALQQQKQLQSITTPPNSNTPARRSTRRNPNADVSSPPLDFSDDDEREEKKVKLVVRLPQSNQHLNRAQSSSLNSVSSDSNADGENQVESNKKRKIGAFARRSDDIGSDQGEKITKVMEIPQGCPLDSGSSTPLPDKKLLVFILDRLQKKDTYGVFSEPVDPNELPDYHQIIEHPMDFGTVRMKLDKGLYSTLQELEADVLLICSNAMQYNSPDTVYYRQARSIQELAKRDFDNLRQEGDDGELQPKVVRRGRPPGKSLKKPVSRSSVDRAGPEISSGATLATGEDNTVGSSAYSLRRPPMMYKLQYADASATSHRPRNGDNHAELSCDWNNEFPARILRADMKYGNKHFLLDETRRDTYKQNHPAACNLESPLLTNVGGDMKQLMAVGLHVDHGYARSLARFAANLGPVAWNVALKKLGTVLPSGVKLDLGYVVKNGVSEQLMLLSSENKISLNRTVNDSRPSGPMYPSASAAYNKENMAEADRIISPLSELALQKCNGASGESSGSSLLNQHNHLLLSNRNNSVNGVASGYNLSRLATLIGPSNLNEASSSSKIIEMVPGCDGMMTANSASANHIAPGEPKLSESSNALLHSAKLFPGMDQQEAAHFGMPSLQVLSPDQRRYPIPVPPDLNVRIQTSSSPSSSSLRIGSPKQQPDLALQL